MKIALIGATGFVGSALLQEALNRGHEVTALVRDPGQLKPTRSCILTKGMSTMSLTWLVWWQAMMR